jgi:uncharacterized protein (DUF1330 family)
MAVYMVFNETVTDQAVFDTYRAQAAPMIVAAGGKYHVRAGAVTVLEGDPKLDRVVIIEWESMEAAKRFYFSPEYQALVKLRQSCTVGTAAIIEGAPPAG